MKNPTLDKNGREIKIGDVLKVYHFQAARYRKHHYMYKQVVGYADHSKDYFKISHLELSDEYWQSLRIDEGVKEHIEIIQGEDLEDRVKYKSYNKNNKRNLK